MGGGWQAMPLSLCNFFQWQLWLVWTGTHLSLAGATKEGHWKIPDAPGSVFAEVDGSETGWSG